MQIINISNNIKNHYKLTLLGQHSSTLLRREYSMAQSSGKKLVEWLVAALLFIALLSGSAHAVAICNIDSSQLNLCRAAVTEKCCAVIRQANLRCLCSYKSILPSFGINPKNALALPAKCGLQLPPNC